MTTITQFNQEHALPQWTAFDQLISSGVYDEYQAKSIDRLETLAASHGFQFVWHADAEQWSIEPMSIEEVAAYQAAQETRPYMEHYGVREFVQALSELNSEPTV